MLIYISICLFISLSVCSSVWLPDCLFKLSVFGLFNDQWPFRHNGTKHHCIATFLKIRSKTESLWVHL